MKRRRVVVLLFAAALIVSTAAEAAAQSYPPPIPRRCARTNATVYAFHARIRVFGGDHCARPGERIDADASDQDGQTHHIGTTLARLNGSYEIRGNLDNLGPGRVFVTVTFADTGATRVIRITVRPRRRSCTGICIGTSGTRISAGTSSAKLPVTSGRVLVLMAWVIALGALATLVVPRRRRRRSAASERRG